MSDPFIGEIRAVAFNYAPVGWALCNGQTLPISQYQALFALLGVTYGGNGQTNFQLPDLQGRVPISAGSGIGLPTYIQGQKGGLESIALTQTQLPMHTHVATFTPSGGGGAPTVNVQGSSAVGTTTTPTGNYLAGSIKVGTTPTSPTYPAYTPTATTPGNIAGVTVSGGGSGGSVTNANTGGSQSFSIEPPYLAVYFIIALQGIFPSRS